MNEEQEHKQLAHRLFNCKLLPEDQAIIINTAKASGIDLTALLGISARVYAANRKTPIQSPRAYFLKAIQTEQRINYG